MTAYLIHALYVFLVTAAPSAGENLVAEETEEGVLVVRHFGAVQARIVVPQEPSPPAGPTEGELRALARLAESGLIHIRPVETDRTNLWSDDAPWNYTPKEYYGYHPKPDFSRHDRAGWRYDPQRGWRYRPEPGWAQQPGAVDAVLSQLPTSGQGWYVTRWR